MKQFIPLTLFCLLSYSIFAQDTEKKAGHQFELNLSLSTTQPRDYSNQIVTFFNPEMVPKTGTSFGFSPKYSLSIKKWFLDVDLNYYYNRALIYVIYNTDPFKAFDLKNSVSTFNPVFYFGRFIRPAEGFRLSLGIGVGYNLLIPHKPKEFVIADYVDDNEYEFYEVKISSYANTPLTLSTGIGIYLPLKKNELCIKLTAATRYFPTSSVELYKIENYQPELIREGNNNLSPFTYGISVGYRFNNLKD